jgi:PAS domain S-box-containing protein
MVDVVGTGSRVLIVDGDPTFLADLEAQFQAAQFTVATAPNAEEASTVFEAVVPNLVILDVSLGTQSVELLRRWIARTPDVVVVLVAGTPSLPTIVSALSEGARRFFIKPVRATEIVHELATSKHELGTASMDDEGVDRFFAISPGLLAIQGFDGYFKMVNPAWERTLGYTAAELCATPYIDLIHPDDREKATDEALEVSAGKSVFRFRNRYRCKDGSYRWLSWSATPSIEHRLIYGSARDVTAVVRMEQGLRASNAILKRAIAEREIHIAASSEKHRALVELDRFKDEVTATLVHDLKNPLSVIVANYDYILEAYEGSADCLAALQDSKSAGQRILRLLNNLVDVAELENVQVEIHRTQTSLFKLMEAIVKQRRVLAQSRGVRLTMAPGPDTSASIDVDLFNRTIENILDNAMRYTPQGGFIQIAIDESPAQIEVRIGNSGAAIPPHLRALVFERYGQVSGTIGSMNLGLGLYFCRTAVEAHGGRIWIEETPAMPTVFVIQLPQVGVVRPASAT